MLPAPRSPSRFVRHRRPVDPHRPRLLSLPLVLARRPRFVAHQRAHSSGRSDPGIAPDTPGPIIGNPRRSSRSSALGRRQPPSHAGLV